MGHDPFSPTSPVRVNVLLIPVGKIKSSRFKSFASKLAKENVVHLERAAISTELNEDLVSPLAFPEGRVLFDFSISSNAAPELETFPFELNRTAQVILGLADGNELSNKRNGQRLDSSRSEPLDRFSLEALLYDFEHNRTHLGRHLVYQLLILGKIPEGIQEASSILVLSGSHDDDTGAKTVMDKVTALLLDEMSVLARGLQNELIQSPGLLSQTVPRSDGQKESMPDPRVNQIDLTGPRVGASRSQTPVPVRESTAVSPPDAQSTRSNKDSGASKAGRLTPTVSNIGLTEAEVNRYKARYQIVLGALHLQAGRWPDALRELSEGAVVTRNTTVDYLWHAKALEYILVCMIMFAWAGMSFSVPQVCYPAAERGQIVKSALSTPSTNASNLSSNSKTATKASIESRQTLTKAIPVVINTILTLYSRASKFSQDKLPQFMLCETRIRLANILVVIHLKGSLDSEALDHLVIGTPLEYDSPAVSAAATNLRKSEIANILVDAASDTGGNISGRILGDLLAGIASCLSRLGLQRKQAFYLKELLHTLTPSLMEARKIGAAEMGIHPAAGLPPVLSKSKNERASAQQSVKALLDMAGKLYGLPSEVSPIPQGGTSQTNTQRIVDRLEAWAQSRDFGDTMLKMEVLRICINICEALPDLPTALHFTVQLLQTSRRTITLSHGANNETPLISEEEQGRLLNSIKRTVNAAPKLGIPDLRTHYWDDFLLRGVQLLDPQSSSKLAPHTQQDLFMAMGDGDGTKKDPFIYNPFSKANPAAGESSVLVAGEMAHFSVILQSPFEFDIEIDHISLLTEGCDFEAAPHCIVLGRFCSQKFVLSGRPMTSGVLRILGCRARIRYCYEQTFLIFPNPWHPPTKVKLKSVKGNARTSVGPLIPSKSSEQMGRLSPPKDIFTIPEAAELSVNVIQAQPTLSIKSATPVQSTMMLLEGEVRSLQLTLQNDSKIPADLLLFTFEDSVSRQIQNALANKELSPEELYELQFQLANKPALSWRPDSGQKKDPTIPAQKTETFTFEIYGKPGLTDAVIQIDYAYLSKLHSEVKEKFYTRQIRFSLAVSVNGSVEIPRCNILSFRADFVQQERQHLDHRAISDGGVDIAVRQSYSQTSQKEIDGRFANLFSKINSDENAKPYCLLLLDMRNVWPNPLKVEVQTGDISAMKLPEERSWLDVLTTHETLQPGHLCRLVLFIPRVFLAEPFTSIPTIGNQRQFVVSTSTTSVEAEAAHREAFWYREELMKHIQGSWAEEGSGRNGTLDLRKAVRLNARMVDILRIDHIEIEFSVHAFQGLPGSKDVHQSADSVTCNGRSRFILRTRTFATLTVRVHNRSREHLHLLLRLQPSLRNQPHNIALDMSKRLAWSGMLQRPLHPVLAPNEIREADLGVTALSEGNFEVGATVEEIKGRRASELPKGIDAGGLSPERRIWHAREPCIIDAVEREDP